MTINNAAIDINIKHKPLHILVIIRLVLVLVLD